MNILFIHQNFPGQFKHLAPALAARGHAVSTLTLRRFDGPQWRGVRVLRYALPRGSTPGIHPWVADLETKAIRGEACFRAALQLRADGYVPDVIVAHPGWGESLFLKEVWPTARLGLYCEFHYLLEGGDLGFDPEFPATDPGEPCRLRLKNANNLLHLQVAHAGLSPTEWQAQSFPLDWRGRITVAHDGIDTVGVTPSASARLQLPGLPVFMREHELITFVNRNLEPQRGYHVFMRALPELLRRRPKARVLIVGGEGAGYGAAPPSGRSWKEVFRAEVAERIAPADWDRVHYTGPLAYPQFVALLQVSRVHVYLSYPFVLSWSLLEAMSAGCAIVASDTAPVREALRHGDTGRLVDFFDVAGLAAEVAGLLDAPDERARLGQAAREAARSRYDLATVCLPRQLAWVESLVG